MIPQLAFRCTTSSNLSESRRLTSPSCHHAEYPWRLRHRENQVGRAFCLVELNEGGLGELPDGTTSPPALQGGTSLSETFAEYSTKLGASL
mmetsp:Transcript_96331/g.210673  ORF Transcript_96331/g.210673 Transcript_96331/m.210673 type:complete len:91 (+) Transcript_96331:95-367(+)